MAFTDFRIDITASTLQCLQSGETPLQDAVQANNLRTAELLVANGADDSERFVYAGMGRRIDGQTIRQRIDATWRELYDD